MKMRRMRLLFSSELSIRGNKFSMKISETIRTYNTITRSAESRKLRKNIRGPDQNRDNS